MTTETDYTDWLHDVIKYADARDFHIDTDGHDHRRLHECFDAGIDAEETVNEFIQDAWEAHCLYQRAPW